MIFATDRSTLVVLRRAAGDLARCLVVPALFELHRASALLEPFQLLGPDRSDLDTRALAERLRDGCACFGRTGTLTDAQWERFARDLTYHRMDLAEPDSCGDFPAPLDEMTQPSPGRVQHICYLATPPFLFAPAAIDLGNAGLVKDRALSRQVVEEPIGSELEGFQHIDGVFESWLDESQLYRMDRYLGKETAQNFLALRFTNPRFEPVRNRRYVDHVTITMAETLGVEHRGGYYEGAGARRGMVQTLLYEVLACDQGLFMRVDRIEGACTLLLDAWGAYPAVDLPNYPDGSWGPESVEGLISRDRRSWLAPSPLEETP